MRTQILLIDDDPDVLAVVSHWLMAAGYDTTVTTSVEEGLVAIGARELDVVITDLDLPGIGGLELCQRVMASRPGLPVLVMTAFGNFENAVAAMRAGACDFLTKPVDEQSLLLRLERVIHERALHEQVKRLRNVVESERRFDDLIGASPAMQRVCDLLGRVATSDASVLITGESGTGKEMVARAIHRRGKHGEGPFVAVNCSAVPEQLLESELFGHARGAFTDARVERDGLFVAANRGTLLLDEIGDMPLALQPKLLRALEERRVRPVGSSKEVAFDARIIAATNRDLEAAVEERRFRDDLYFRLAVIHVPIPPLRARGADVLVLAQDFVHRFALQSQKAVTGLSAAAAENLLSYGWPGNVRELRNCIERAVALTRHEQLLVDDLPENVRNHRPTQLVVSSDDPADLLPMEAIERRYIAQVMEAVGGNKTLAARVLGYDRTTLYRKLERYASEPTERRKRASGQ